jgi:hypothetical protein
MKRINLTVLLVLLLMLATTPAAWGHVPFADLHDTPAAEMGTPSQGKAGCLTVTDQNFFGPHPFEPSPTLIAEAARDHASTECSGPASA